MSKSLEVIHPHAAGIDIGSRSFYVDAGEEEVKIFPTYTEGCHALRDYLKVRSIDTVAMESTGVFWVILYAVLEDAGIEVYLVNGRDVKNVPGRKSDVKDCQWLRQLHAYGLLRKSFIPEDNIRKLRNYMRLRQDHIRAQATQVHLMQKALTQMNVRLTEVIDDIMGVSGAKIIAAILDGQRDPSVLVEFCHQSILKTKRELVVKALEGEYREEHLFALRQAHQTWHYYQTLIAECDGQVNILLQSITHDKDDIVINAKRKPIRYNRPDIDDLHQPLLKMTEGKDPTGIAGITDYSFLQIVSEVGVDMSAWKTEKHFVSWLKLAPVKSSSGTVSRRLTVKRTNKASLLFRSVAQGLLNSKHLALGSFGRRIRAKRGSGVAIKAIARKIACYYYRVMTKGEAFVDKGIALYEEQQNQQQMKYLERLAIKMRMQLVPLS
jgi:transposase